METSYSDDDLLMLSGIQHYCFCERQWALIHIEQQWADNVRTVEGHHLHERVDDAFFDESRGNLTIVRAMPLVSRKLGLHGIADVVEFYRCEKENEDGGITLEGKKGKWHPRPVEYKRGKPKVDERDIVQLCAQAMCLEEMLSTTILSGDLFYNQIKHREKVQFTDELRNRVTELASSMHNAFLKGTTPPVPKGKRCSLCSMQEACKPEWAKKAKSAKLYNEQMIAYYKSDTQQEA